MHERVERERKRAIRRSFRRLISFTKILFDLTNQSIEQRKKKKNYFRLAALDLKACCRPRVHLNYRWLVEFFSLSAVLPFIWKSLLFDASLHTHTHTLWVLCDTFSNQITLMFGSTRTRRAPTKQQPVTAALPVNVFISRSPSLVWLCTLARSRCLYVWQLLSSSSDFRLFFPVFVFTD